MFAIALTAWAQVASPARGHHPGTEWIMAGGYTDEDGVSCCSPHRDCLPATQGEIRRIEGGWLHVPTQTMLMDDSSAIRMSGDASGRMWRCVRNLKLKCLFLGIGG